MIIEITEENKDIINEGTVLIDFWAEWCGPCRAMLPILKELSEQRPKINICKVNVDDLSELASEYGVRAIPTLVLLKDGVVVGSNSGMISLDKLNNFIDEFVKCEQ